MAIRVTPGASPSFSVVAPFLCVAPLALVVAGVGVTLTGPETFIAVNARHTVAIVHALLLGWLTLTMMGALYQLAPAALGAPVRSARLARLQFWVHVAGLTIFVPATWEWALPWMAAGGGLVVLSVVLFLANVLRLGLWDPRLPVRYVRLGQIFLAVTVLAGFTFVANHSYGWFAITPGVLAAHAHLGLAGWIGLTLMGVSYQLVPMFNLVPGARPRFGIAALALALGGLIAFVATMPADPARPLRLAVALPLLLGVALHGLDQARLFRARARRRVDIQGRATVASLGFLGCTCAAAVGAAWGMPFGTETEPARWPLAYGLLGVAGWAGTAVIGNSHKILPFLVWYHGYRPRTGGQARGSDVLLRDLYSDRLATGILALHCAATVTLAGSALTGWLDGLHAGGVLLALSGALQLVSFAWMLVPRAAGRQHPPLEAAK